MLTETLYILYVAMAIGFKLQYEVIMRTVRYYFNFYSAEAGYGGVGAGRPGAGVPVKVEAFSVTPHAPPSPIGG